MKIAADEIWALAKTRPAGVTRTDVRDLFSRNKKARAASRGSDPRVDERRGSAEALSYACRGLWQPSHVMLSRGFVKDAAGS